MFRPEAEIGHETFTSESRGRTRGKRDAETMLPKDGPSTKGRTRAQQAERMIHLLPVDDRS
jgi:hypothetical protein